MDLSWLLGGPSEDNRVGPEQGEPVSDGITKYIDPYGSNRYVYYIQGQAVAGIQVMWDGEQAKVAGVYTHPDFRHQQAATKLFDFAREDFPDLVHSPRDELSDDARGWADTL